MGRRDDMAPHEAAESLLIHLWLDRRQLRLRSLQKLGFHKVFRLLIAVPKLQEIDYRKVKGLSAIRTFEYVPFKSFKLTFRHLRPKALFAARARFLKTEVIRDMEPILDPKKHRVIHDAMIC